MWSLNGLISSLALYVCNNIALTLSLLCPGFLHSFPMKAAPQAAVVSCSRLLKPGAQFVLLFSFQFQQATLPVRKMFFILPFVVLCLWGFKWIHLLPPVSCQKVERCTSHLVTSSLHRNLSDGIHGRVRRLGRLLMTLKLIIFFLERIFHLQSSLLISISSLVRWGFFPPWEILTGCFYWVDNIIKDTSFLSYCAAIYSFLACPQTGYSIIIGQL